MSTDAVPPGRGVLPAASLDGMETNEMTVSHAGPADLIATIWYRLGYKPRDSLVIAGLEGRRLRVGTMMRADLPDLPELVDLSDVSDLPEGQDVPAVADPLAAVVRDCLGLFVARGTGAVVALVVREGVLGGPSPAIVAVLRREVAAQGLRLVDVLGVTATGFGSLLCGDPRCCPPGGRPIEEVLSSRSAAAHVVQGATVAESEAALIADVTSELMPVVPVGRGGSAGPVGSAGPQGLAGPGGLAEPGGSAEPGGPVGGLAPVERWHWWRRWTEACGGSGSVLPVAGLSAALHDSQLRDALLLNLFGATPEAVSALVDGTEHLEALNERVDGDLRRRLLRPPEEHRFEPGRTVLAAAVRVAAPGDRAPGLAVLAMVAWFEGKGGTARLLAEQARADSSRVSLTGLVEGLLRQRVPPPWLGAAPRG